MSVHGIIVGAAFKLLGTVYHRGMRIEFDPDKDKENIRKHGLSLARAVDFEISGALIEEDTRKEYGERRYNALGMLDGRMYSLTHCYRAGAIRAISLR